MAGNLVIDNINGVDVASSPILNDTQLRSALNASGTAPIYACRAWVNFNGTGTVAIRASGNVSSITDNGTGDYTVNFTTAMPDINYGVSFGATHVYNASNLDFGIIGLKPNNGGVTPRSTTSIKVVSSTYSGSAVLVDNIDCNVSIFR